MTNLKMHHDKHYTYIVLHAIYPESFKQSARCDVCTKLRRVKAPRESSSIRYIQHHEVRENTTSIVPQYFGDG